MIDWAAYPNFTEDEMRCRCGCGKADMDPTFMAALQWVRDGLGWPLPITSGFRCSDYDTAIDGAGVHPSGKAADVAAAGERVYHLLHTAIGAKMTGIGLKQHGPHAKRFIHLDQTVGDLRPRIWTYT